jgi:membrane-associated HD superfamily phosphohydrolase
VFLWTILVAAVLVEWPIRGALYPVALAISLYTVAALMRRAEALAAAVLTAAVVLPAAGQAGWLSSWLPAVYEIAATAAVLLLGLYVSTRRAYLAELRDRAQRMERERDQNTALAGRCTTAWPITSR